MKEIKNNTDLRKMICKTMIDVRSGSCDTAVASEVNNAAGKIVQTVKLDMEYSRQRKETPVIEFMGE